MKLNHNFLQGDTTDESPVRAETDFEAQNKEGQELAGTEMRDQIKVKLLL